MMQNIDIAWFIEHTSRELDVACAACYFLERKFDRTYKILPYNQSTSANFFHQYNPKIIVIPYCYSVHDSGLRDILSFWLTPIYVNLSWEQLFYKANLDYKAPKDLFTKKYVFHHVWSKNYSEHLQKHGVPKEHIFINGQPAYQLYKYPYRDCFATRDELANRFSLNKDYRWIFFPENYSWAFYPPHQIEQIIKYGQDRKAAYLMRDYCQDSFQDVIKWLKEIAVNEGIEIILRPRPATRPSDFFAAVYKIIQTIPSNLHIIQDYSVREWILASNIVLSSFSTSLIEAAVASKPVYMVEPVAIPKPLQSDWYKYTKRLTDKNQFIRTCLNQTDNQSGIKLRQWAIHHLLGNKDPIFNLAKFLNGLLSSQSRRPSVATRTLIKNASNMLPKPSKISWILGKIRYLYSKIYLQAQKNISQDTFDKKVKARMNLFAEKIL